MRIHIKPEDRAKYRELLQQYGPRGIPFGQYIEKALSEPMLSWPRERLTRSSDLPDARHSISFNSVHWFGRDYAFTKQQAAIVKMLWEAWENGTPDIAWETLLDQSGSQCKEFRAAFENGKHPAFGSMIIPGDTKGTFRLFSTQF